MTDHPLLSVRGEAVREVEPELARLGVVVTARHAERAVALRQVDDAAQTVDRVFAGFDDAIAAVETVGLRVSPWMDHGGKRPRVTGHVATVAHTVTVTDFARLGELFAQLAALDLVELHGPWWELRPGSSAHRDARTDAAREAVRRARDYAAALGSELVELVEMADTNLLTGQAGADPRLMPGGMALSARSAMGPSPDVSFEVTPRKLTVEARVEARFRMRSPDLSTIA